MDGELYPDEDSSGSGTDEIADTSNLNSAHAPSESDEPECDTQVVDERDEPTVIGECPELVEEVTREAEEEKYDGEHLLSDCL